MSKFTRILQFGIMLFATYVILSTKPVDLFSEIFGYGSVSFLWVFVCITQYRDYRNRMIVLLEYESAPVSHAWIYAKRAHFLAATSLLRFDRSDLPTLKKIDPEKAELFEKRLNSPIQAVIMTNLALLGHFGRKKLQNPDDIADWLNMVEIHKLSHWAGGDHDGKDDEEQFRKDQGWNQVIGELVVAL